jgi:hypothetical protein
MAAILGRWRVVLGCVAAAAGMLLYLPGCLPPTSGTGDSGVTGKYVGAAVCVTCHLNRHTEWSKTLHASALDTLEAIGYGTDPNCLKCHTVGYGQPGGFVNRATTNSLAGVQCEDCHGAARDHVNNVAEVSLRPPVNLPASVCGGCHTTSHYPTYDQWLSSSHSKVTSVPAGDFAAGQLLTVCGVCHSGDYRLEAIILGNTVDNSLLTGKDPNTMNAVTCVICHDPHGRTNNAVDPGDNRDYQLRYKEVASPAQENSIALTTDPNRFNLCGHCHHSRGNTWETTGRGPHHSIQSNMYVGEMPMPAGQENMPLVPNQRSIHAFVIEQCSTCHLYRTPTNDPQAPATLSNHSMKINYNACNAVACHPSAADAQASVTSLQKQVNTRLDNIAARLGDPNTWEYSQEGGPNDAGQAALSDEIKKIRYLYSYILSDGSLGPHNPQYIKEMLTEAESLLTSIGK